MVVDAAGRGHSVARFGSCVPPNALDDGVRQAGATFASTGARFVNTFAEG
jgi:hypothetical protein